MPQPSPTFLPSARVLVHHGPRRSATMLRAEDDVMKRVVGDDRNDDCGSNDAAIVVVQHVSMRPTSRGGGEPSSTGILVERLTGNLAMLLTCRRHVGPMAKCRHILPTCLCRGDTKLIPTQHFCVGDGRHSPPSSFRVPEVDLVCGYGWGSREIHVF